MGSIIVVGGGVVGLGAALMLANDGHQVTLLERDPAPPPPPGEAWDHWERRGVSHFRMIHLLLAASTEIAESEIPGFVEALTAAGGLNLKPLRGLPDAITGGARPGDERLRLVTARRPVFEAVIAALAEAADGVTVRRGVAVTGLLADGPTSGSQPVHVVGVVTDDGAELRADIVIDCGGRRSAMPDLIEAAGGRRPDEQIEDSGFVYYARHFRSADGSIPMAFGGLLQHYPTVSLLTLPADNGTWGVGIVTAGSDAPLRGLTDVDRWTAVVNAHPFVAHWVDAEPLTDVKVMAGIEDRRRTYIADGKPVVTGLLPLADAWACTNPSLGRGVSIGFLHASALRSTLHGETFEDHYGLALRWHHATERDVEPYYDDTLAFDRHRLAEVHAAIDGRDYEPNDPTWTFTKNLAASTAKDPDLLRAQIKVSMLLDRLPNVMQDTELVGRAARLADHSPIPGPDRPELLALAART